MRTLIAFIFFTLLFGTTGFAQPFRERVMDSVMLKNFNNQHFHQMTTTWIQDGETELTDIQVYDQRGLRTEHIFFNSLRWVRHKEEYDSLKRKTAFIFYRDDDTSVISSKHVYTYPDSLSSKEEVYNRGTELTETTYREYKRSADTLWVTETETHVNGKFPRKSLSRYTQKGDSLTISEFVSFDQHGKIKDIKTYYRLKRTDKKGNAVYTSGKYDVVVDESLLNDEALYLDALQHPEKYMQYQLDGKYPYTYGEEITSTKVYDPKEKLISSWEGDGKTYYFYNPQGQIIKTESFSKPRSGEKERKMHERIYYYDQHGLPSKVVDTALDTGKTITYRIEFK
jgi:hypothetical protein